MTVSTSYRKQKKLATVGDTHRSALVRDVLQEFTAAYNTFGQETNTPAIITSVIHEDMSFFLFCERFLNNAVSLFVTMGLLGTFLGLSLSVSSLSQLLAALPTGRTPSTTWEAVCCPLCPAWASHSTPRWWALAAPLF